MPPSPNLKVPCTRPIKNFLLLSTKYFYRIFVGVLNFDAGKKGGDFVRTAVVHKATLGIKLKLSEMA